MSQNRGVEAQSISFSSRSGGGSRILDWVLKKQFFGCFLYSFVPFLCNWKLLVLRGSVQRLLEPKSRLKSSSTRSPWWPRHSDKANSANIAQCAIFKIFYIELLSITSIINVTPISLSISEGGGGPSTFRILSDESGLHQHLFRNINFYREDVWEICPW